MNIIRITVTEIYSIKVYLCERLFGMKYTSAIWGFVVNHRDAPHVVVRFSTSTIQQYGMETDYETQAYQASKRR